LKGEDIEIALTHSKTQYSEEYHSFVNGQNTTQGGTHLAAYREATVKPLGSSTTKVRGI
jgi:topoisomerase-4 subunit B